MQHAERREVKLGFLDGLARLFRRHAGPDAAAEAPDDAEAELAAMQAEFESALCALHEKIEAQRASRPVLGVAAAPGVDRQAEKERRTEATHRAIREDILVKHAELGTGIGDRELDALRAFLDELQTVAAAGRRSHEILPRMRYAIAERLWREAGPLAVSRIVALLEQRKLEWPDPIRPGPTDSPALIETARQRRLRDVEETFLALDFARTAERLVGFVRGWGDDYPDRGSPLWEETVLEAVGCALRTRLVLAAVDVLRRDRDAVLARAEEAIGAEVAALQRTVAGGVLSIEQASQAAAGVMRVLDEVVPAMAWEHVQTQLPETRERSGT